MRVGLATVAAALLPASRLPLSTATSRDVRSATCFSSAISRFSGADSAAAAWGSGPVDVTGTGPAGAAAVVDRRVEGTLVVAPLLAGPAALALRAGADVVVFFVAGFFAGAFLPGAVVAATFRVVAFFFAAEGFLATALTGGVLAGPTCAAA